MSERNSDLEKNQEAFLRSIENDQPVSRYGVFCDGMFLVDGESIPDIQEKAQLVISEFDVDAESVNLWIFDFENPKLPPSRFPLD